MGNSPRTDESTLFCIEEIARDGERQDVRLYAVDATISGSTGVMTHSGVENDPVYIAAYSGGDNERYWMETTGTEVTLDPRANTALRLAVQNGVLLGATNRGDSDFIVL